MMYKRKILIHIFLTYLFQVTFPKVKAKLKLEALQKNVPQLTQACFSDKLYIELTFCVQNHNLELLGWSHVSDTLGT